MEIQLNSLIIWSKASNLRFHEIEQEIANVSISIDYSIKDFELLNF